MLKIDYDYAIDWYRLLFRLNKKNWNYYYKSAKFYGLNLKSGQLKFYSQLKKI
jgi:hypothetical protein